MTSFLMNHSIVSYDALNGSFVEQYVKHDRYTLPFASKQGRERERQESYKVMFYHDGNHYDIKN
jgi:hypothetical protein